MPEQSETKNTIRELTLDEPVAVSGGDGPGGGPNCPPPPATCTTDITDGGGGAADGW